MTDLDRIAINDMAHELCDVSPCESCGKRVFCTNPDGVCDSLAGHEFEQVKPNGRNIAPWVMTKCPRQA